MEKRLSWLLSDVLGQASVRYLSEDFFLAPLFDGRFIVA
jgi:hypothetical protein